MAFRFGRSTDGTKGVFTLEESEIGCTVNKSESEAFFRDVRGHGWTEKSRGVGRSTLEVHQENQRRDDDKWWIDSKNGTPMAPKRISAVPVAAPVIQQAQLSTTTARDHSFRWETKNYAHGERSGYASHRLASCCEATAANYH